MDDAQFRLTPAAFRSKARALLLEAQATDAGRLVTRVVAWVRRQLFAEARCDHPGCTNTATHQPLDGGGGGVCDDHLEDPDVVYGCCTLEEGHDGPCVWICHECNGTGRCPICSENCRCDDVVKCAWCDGLEVCPGGCYEGQIIDDDAF